MNDNSLNEIWNTPSFVSRALSEVHMIEN